MAINFKDMLNEYVLAIGNDTFGILEQIKDRFHLNKRQFNDQFKEDFIEKSKQRIAIKYGQFIGRRQDERKNVIPIIEPLVKRETDDNSIIKIENIDDGFNATDQSQRFTVWHPLTSNKAQQHSSQIRSRKSSIACEFCSKRFKRKDYLIRHMRTHVDQFAFQCSICRQGFSQRIEWQSHEMNCKQKRFKCELCQYVTLCKSKMVCHMRVHSRERPFSCDICGNRFKLKGDLNRHIKTHSNKFQYKCLIFQRRFSQQNQWQSHEMKCNPKRFECDLCEYATLDKWKMKRHKCIHTGEKPFECEICGKQFNRNDNLNAHMRTHKRVFSGISSSKSAPIRSIHR